MQTQKLKKIATWSAVLTVLAILVYISPLGSNITRFLQGNLLSQSTYTRDSGLYLGNVVTPNGESVIKADIGARLETSEFLNGSGAVIVHLSAVTGNSTFTVNSLNGQLLYDPNLLQLQDKTLSPAQNMSVDTGITSVIKDANGKETGILRFSVDKINGNFTKPEEKVADIFFIPKTRKITSSVELKDIRLLVVPPSSANTGLYLNKGTSTQTNLIASPLTIATNGILLSTETVITTGSGTVIKETRVDLNDYKVITEKWNTTDLNNEIIKHTLETYIDPTGFVYKTIYTVEYPDGSIYIEEKNFNPDGSYTVKTTLITPDKKQLIIEKKYDKDGNLISTTIIRDDINVSKEQILTSTGGIITVTVPAGAVANTVVVTLTEIDKSKITLGDNKLPATNAFEIVATDTNSNMPISDFLIPVTLDFKYDPATLPTIPGMILEKIIPMTNVNGQWVPIPANDIISTKNGEITFTTKKPGQFVLAALFIPKPSNTAQSEYAFNNAPTAPKPTSTNPGNTAASSGSVSSGGTIGNIRGSATPTPENSSINGASTRTTSNNGSTPTPDMGSKPMDYLSADSSCIPSAPFTDTKGHWGEAYIEQARTLCIISGKTPGKFAPNAFVTRAELTKIAVNAFKKKLATDLKTKPFQDIALNMWYSIYIVTAKMEAMISGYPDGTFKPLNEINRVEALKIMLGAGKIRTTGFGGEATFSDTSKVAWYAPFVGYAKVNRIVKGYPEQGKVVFKPSQQITRAEAVKIMIEILKTTSLQ